MKKEVLLLVIILLFLVSGCSLSAIASVSFDGKQYGCDKRFSEEARLEANKLNKQILGFSKDQVNNNLGKPKDIKFALPYVINEGCFGKDCLTKIGDEAWFYEFKKKFDKCGTYFYTIIVYFSEDKVVKVH